MVRQLDRERVTVFTMATVFRTGALREARVRTGIR